MRHHHDIERQIEFDFLRATEIAALNTLQWLGKGQKEPADAAACDAIRGMFDLVDIRGEITIGEGIKDEAPGLFKGEKVGSWSEGSPRFEIALDPVDGTTNVAKGMPNSLSCIAAALAPAMQTSDIDLYAGIGVAPEAILSAAGVRGNVATTHSVLMRNRSGTVRFVEAHHDLDRKTIHLRSTRAERRV